MNRSIIQLVLGVMICLLMLFSPSCKHNPYSANITRMDGGAFYTHDLKAAQYEIPYTIILPTYIPLNMDSDESDFLVLCQPHPIKYSDRSIGTLITFRNDSEGKLLVIYENYPKDKIYLDFKKSFEPTIIDGIDVYSAVAPQRTDINNDWGLAFSWYCNDFPYSIETYSISKEDSILVVESMIKQMIPSGINAQIIRNIDGVLF
jgi:hypothetical protein